MRRWSAFIGSLAIAYAGDDVAQLLENVSERYQSITAYVIDIQRTKVGSMLGADAIAVKPGADQILIARSGNRFRYEASGIMRVTWVSDGQQTWVYRHDVNEYTVEPAHEWPTRPGPGRGIEGLDWEYVSRFRDLAGMAGRASLVKAEIPPDRVCPGTTALIKIDVGDPREPATEELRIDISSNLVCQSLVRARKVIRVTPADYTTDTRWRYRQLAEPVDPNLFTFNPRRAKLVKRLSPPPAPMQ